MTWDWVSNEGGDQYDILVSTNDKPFVYADAYYEEDIVPITNLISYDVGSHQSYTEKGPGYRTWHSVSPAPGAVEYADGPEDYLIYGPITGFFSKLLFRYAVKPVAVATGRMLAPIIINATKPLLTPVRKAITTGVNNARKAIVETMQATMGTASRNAAKGGSILADASKAAFNAADDVGSIFIKNKHLSTATGNYAKFATTEVSTAQGWVQQALRSPNARFLPNPQIPNTFQVVTDLGTTIGTKGQTSIRAIVGFDGKVINAFPVK